MPPEVDSSILIRLKETYARVIDMDISSRPRLRRVTPTHYVKNLLSEVNRCIDVILSDQFPSLLQCNQLLFAAALTVVELVCSNSKTTRRMLGTTDWKIRLWS